MERNKYQYLPVPGAGGEGEQRPPEPPANYPCPCCGQITLPVPKEEAIAFICPHCWWENDVFDPDEDTPSDENRGLTLRLGRENYKKFGIADPALREARDRLRGN